MNKNLVLAFTLFAGLTQSVFCMDMDLQGPIQPGDDKVVNDFLKDIYESRSEASDYIALKFRDHHEQKAVQELVEALRACERAKKEAINLCKLNSKKLALNEVLRDFQVKKKIDSASESRIVKQRKSRVRSVLKFVWRHKFKFIIAGATATCVVISILLPSVRDEALQRFVSFGAGAIDLIKSMQAPVSVCPTPVCPTPICPKLYCPSPICPQPVCPEFDCPTFICPEPVDCPTFDYPGLLVCPDLLKKCADDLEAYENLFESLKQF